MRNELELMELVERYLRDELNSQDRSAFEQRMQTNSEIGELVRDQQALLIGMERLGVRIAVERAYRSYRFGKWAPGIGGAVIVLILMVGVSLFDRNKEASSTEIMSDPIEVLSVEPVHTVPGDADIPGDDIPAEEAPSQKMILGTVEKEDRIEQADSPGEASIMYFADTSAVEPPLSDTDVELAPEQNDKGSNDPSYVRSTPMHAQEEIHYQMSSAIDAPEYPGGDRAMRQFIYSQLKIPAEAQRLGLKQDVVVRFIVDKDGMITAVKADQGPGMGCEEEAERVIRSMPQWKPGMQGDEPVAVQITLPITFLPRMELME